MPWASYLQAENFYLNIVILQGAWASWVTVFIQLFILVPVWNANPLLFSRFSDDQGRSALFSGLSKKRKEFDFIFTHSPVASVDITGPEGKVTILHVHFTLHIQDLPQNPTRLGSNFGHFR